MCRKYTDEIHRLRDEGLITDEFLTDALLKWLSENEIEDFYKFYFPDTEVND